MSIILKAENISKQYRLGLVGTGTISHDLNRWWHKVRGKEDPYLKVGAVNDRSTKADSEYVWALQDINFEVQEGEVLGIIGKNGAGKSTLLKILSRVTSPTTGEIKTRGRIASLLEVGTGFHPELTGRENIYLNGAILGMTKAEIKDKENEIIDFSGCERYVDTPVKRYSSGMRVRLAFAVAAFLEPDILVIDEVLAVGDAEFQKKAIGKMQDISKSDGRTVLFVSHNMAAVKNLCTRTIILNNGTIFYNGETNDAINVYFNENNYIFNEIQFPIKLNDVIINNFFIDDALRFQTSTLLLGENYNLNLNILSKSDNQLYLNIRFQIFDIDYNLLTTLNTFHSEMQRKVNNVAPVNFICQINKLNLVPGKYLIGIEILDLNQTKILYTNDLFFKFVVQNSDYYGTGKLPTTQNMGKFFINHNWIINK